MIAVDTNAKSDIMKNIIKIIWLPTQHKGTSVESAMQSRGALTGKRLLMERNGIISSITMSSFY